MKEFYKKHEVVILTIGGSAIIVTVGVLLGNKLRNNLPIKDNVALSYDDSAERAILESYGVVFKQGYQVPFATKEIAAKFMEERGKTYQLDILSDLTSVIWISK